MSSKSVLGCKSLGFFPIVDRVAALYLSELSGGMQKRAGLVRESTAEPGSFFDELTTGLDPIMGVAIDRVVSGCVKGVGAGDIQ